MKFHRIFNEDCLEGLQKLSDKSVDLICTDPPYCVGTTSNGSKGSWLDNNLIKPFFDSLFKQWQRVLKDESEIYINTDWRTYPFLYPILQKYFTIRNLIVWDCEFPRAGNHYRFSHEFVIYATNTPKRRYFSASERDVWRILQKIPKAENMKLHKVQKPIELVEKMILNSSLPEDTVLDCFMGSGTTAVAALNLNRSFIGFEIDEKYFEIARNRIAERIGENDGS